MTLAADGAREAGFTDSQRPHLRAGEAAKLPTSANLTFHSVLPAGLTYSTAESSTVSRAGLLTRP